MKIKCIDNSCFEHQLTIDKVYKPLEQEEGVFEYDGYYEIKDDNGRLVEFRVRRFEVMFE